MVRFGIAGCGIIGETHAAALTRIAGAELAAVADIAAERAEAFAHRYGADAHGSFEELVARGDIDVVSICTASGLHAEQAMAAMRAGKDVVVEKPMALTVESCDAMNRTADEAGRKLAVIYQKRFFPAFKQMKQAVDEGRLGRPVLGDVYLKWYRSQAYYDAGGWRGTWCMDGGGALMNQTIHYVDLLIWLMGPVASVQAYAATLAHEIETEDTAVAILKFRSGALGVIEGTTSAYPGLWTRLEIHGAGGTMTAENDRLVTRLLADEQPAEPGMFGLKALPTQAHEALDPPPYSHDEQLADMVAAVEQGREPAVNGREGRRAIALLSAIYEAARTGQEVRMDAEG
jgi:UDP-N-acetyl-2-amino-2-deoxyglucuronate dehydrogenase